MPVIVLIATMVHVRLLAELQTAHVTMVILVIIVTVTFVTARHAMGMATVLLIQTMVPVINAIVILDIPVPIV